MFVRHSIETAVVLPDEITFIQRTAMPIMTDKQVGVNLPYEFSNLIPENEDEYLYDYSVLSIDQEKGTMNVIAAAVRRELVDNYRDMFQHAGMNIVKAVPKAVCLQKFVRKCLPDGKDNDGDGRVDEEKLNGSDDDGDGLIDEDLGY